MCLRSVNLFQVLPFVKCAAFLCFKIEKKDVDVVNERSLLRILDSLIAKTFEIFLSTKLFIFRRRALIGKNKQ